MTTRGFEVAAWLQAKLPDPSDHRRPLRLTPGQIDFLAAWYELDATGRYAHRRAALQMPKGWGKSPLAAMVAIAELVGPVLPDGEPWGDPLVQIAALSESQADSNVFSLARELLVANDAKAAGALGIDVGRGRFYLRGRPGKLEAVTSEAPSREGQRLTFAIIDETHLWTRRNGGLALARTIRRNAAKMGGRVVETSNAPELGLGSVAEATLADVTAGHAGMLLVAQRPAVTPEATMPDAELLALLRQVYRDAPWIDTERILAEVRDPATPWDESLRYFFNAPAGGTAVLVEPAVWSAGSRHSGDLPDGTRLALGFDGSHSQDGTAIVACTVDGRLSLELLIERDATDPADWVVPRGLVTDTVAALFARYDVTRLLADPYHWRDEIAEWAREHGEDRVIEYPTNSVRRFGPAVDRFRAALAAGRISHDGDPDLTRHLLNARLLRGRGAAADGGHALFTLEKPGPGRLIDAAVAAVLAYEAMATSPPPEPEREPMVAWA
jgi:hypothetical protein